MKIKTITDAIEEFAPKTLAEPWDNPGLMMGSLSNECTGVVCALDLTFEVVDEALANGCNLIVTHHPFFLSAIKSIDTDESKGLLIKKVLENGLTVYSAHTNLDECDGGLCQSLAKTLGGENLCPNGVGVVCDIKATTLGQFARHVASVLGDDSVKFAGDANKKIAKMLCICGGGAAVCKASRGRFRDGRLQTSSVRCLAKRQFSHRGIFALSQRDSGGRIVCKHHRSAGSENHQIKTNLSFYDSRRIS